jgi:CheY-like chemotaxis protein
MVFALLSIFCICFILRALFKPFPLPLMQSKLLTFLVDDYEDDQEFFLMVMKDSFQYVECVFANDGLQAINKLNLDTSFVPQIILIDINMPRINGIELLAEIKKLHRFKNALIYMYSTSAEPAVVEKCTQLGQTVLLKRRQQTKDCKKIFSNCSEASGSNSMT